MGLRSRTGLLCLLSVTGWSSAALAQSAPSAVVLVMESGGGVRAASQLRASLNRRSKLPIMSLAEAQKTHTAPGAVLTVATDPTRVTSVMYWDQTGSTDVLSAPTPQSAAQVDAVVLALTSALLERHHDELTSNPEAIAERVRAVDVARTSRAFYAMLGRLGGASPRTNVQLRFEDF